MNRRWFFGLLAAAALLPKRAVGQLKYRSYTIEYSRNFVHTLPSGKVVKVGEITSSPGLLWNITDEGLDE